MTDEKIAELRMLLDDVRIWKGEAVNRSEHMIELNLDRAAQGVEIMQLEEPATAAEARAGKMGEAGENLLIAIGMGWDLDGCVEVLRAALQGGE